MTPAQQIKYGAALSYIGIGIYILIGLLYTPWMINILGKEDYGLYTLAYSIITLFVFDFGISTAIQRFVAKYLAEGSYIKVNQCLSTVYRIYLYIDVVILIILGVTYYFIPEIYRELTETQIHKLKIIFVMAGVFSVISFPFMPINGILSAYEKFVQLKACDLFSKVAIVLVSIICLLIGMGLYALVLTNVIVGFVTILLKLIIVRRETTITIDLFYHNKTELKAILGFSTWTMIVAVCQRCIFSISPSILATYESAAVIAVFGVAICLEGYCFTFAYALNGLFLPKVSRLLNEKIDILPLMIKVGRIQIFIIGLIVMTFIIVGKSFILAWLGNGYEQVYQCALLLIIPAFFILPADIADQTLIASGKVRFRAMVYLIMAAVNLILAFVFTRIAGVQGMALSIFTAYMVRNIALYYVYYKKLHINIFRFLHESFVKMSPALLITFLLSWVLTNMIPINGGWVTVITQIATVTICFFSTMWLIALNSDEKKLIGNLFRRFYAILNVK